MTDTRQANLARVASLLAEMRERDGVKLSGFVAPADPMARLAELRDHYRAHPAMLSEEARATIPDYLLTREAAE